MIGKYNKIKLCSFKRTQNYIATTSCWNRCYGKCDIVEKIEESNNDELHKKFIALFNEPSVDLEFGFGRAIGQF